jgi:tagaturonate reductase
MVIVPTELIPENGNKLKSILLALSAFNKLDPAFINWLEKANDFCNSLVDRIVPGKLNAKEHQEICTQLGYDDDLMIMCEPYSLWAIETKRGKTRELLSFSRVNEAVKITGDISKYKELKLRLLNATHSFSCALAMFCGFQSVKEAMATEYFRKYVLLLMLNEIKPLVVSETITDKEAQVFAQQVIDRFRNNSIEHLWVNISMQYTMKMAMRCVPLLMKHYELKKPAPKLMLLGFAAYLLLLKTEENTNGGYQAVIGDKQIQLTDEKAPILFHHWQKETLKNCVSGILKEAQIWNNNLLQFPDFESDLLNAINELQEISVHIILQNLVPQKQGNEK